MPSVETAVIATLFPFPAFFAVTTPLEVTVAYFLFDVQNARVLLAFLPVAFTAAFTVIFLPAATVFFLQDKVIFFTAMWLLSWQACHRES